MLLRRFALLLPLLLASCTSYVWVKPVGDPSTFAAESYACKQEATAAAPPVYNQTEVYPVAFAGPDIARTSCVRHGPRQSCNTIYYMDSYRTAPPLIMDVNERLRDDLYSSCMGAKGWVLQAVEE